MAPKFKRYMALFLTVVLVLSMSPAAFAAEDILSALEILESIQLPEATEAPEATEVPEATEAPEATETPEVTEVPEVTEAPEATEVPEATEAPEAVVSQSGQILAASGDNAVYFDLSLGDVTVNASTYSGTVYVYDGSTYTATAVSGVHSNSNRYYVFQSNEAENIYGYVTLDSENNVTGVVTPAYPDMGTDWGAYISQYQPVENVVSNWAANATGRAPTGNKIYFSGAKDYTLTVDNIWSNYTETGSNRKESSISFVAAANGTMDLTFVGHNRIEGLHYSSNIRSERSAGTGNRMNLHGATDSDTLTAAYTDASSSNTYHAVIGGAHTYCGKPLEISGGILYVGAAGTYNTAIGGGANGDADILISGGTVTAVANSLGTAIGGGYGGSSGGADAAVTVTDGTVNAYNLGTGVAIGGGTATGSTTGGIAVVTIAGGTVTASTNGQGPAIGGGNHTKATGGTGTVDITGGSVTATTKGTIAVGGGSGITNNGETIVGIAPEAITALDNSGAKKVAYYNSENVLQYTFYRSGSVTPEFEAPKEDKFAGYAFYAWNTQIDGNGDPWSETLSGNADYYPVWAKLPFTDTIYFDLALGNVIIDGTTYQGKIYDQSSDRVLTLWGKHTEGQKYYVYQSVEGHPEDTGINEEGTGVDLPAYDRVSGWAEYITDNQSVSDVVSAWKDRAEGRTATKNRIHITGSPAYDLTVDDIWSEYVEVSTSRSTGSIAYNPSGSGSMLLTFMGDNRVENVEYRSNANTGLTITGKTAGDTLTAAATIPGNSYWNSAIGSDNGHKMAWGLTITGGTIFAGTHREDNCTAIGGGGNAVGEVIITGGTVTAVASTSGAAIGGGIGFHGVGGNAYVTISGDDTRVYAYNHGIILEDTNKSGNYYGQLFAVPAVAIGGGSSVESSGNAETVVNIHGGTVVAQSVYGAAIGGGGSSTQHGGDATINIYGGTVIAKSIEGTVWGIKDEVGNDNRGESMGVEAGVSIGGGTGALSGGNATLTISGGTIRTGSIGGGRATEEGKPLGFAKVTISGGNTQGQVIMQSLGEDSQEHCSFTMTDGVMDNTAHKTAKTQTFTSNGHTFTFLESSGGVVCMYDGNGMTDISGGTIQNAYAVNGGAVYMTGGTFTMTGGTIQNCSAEEDGGAVYLGGGAVKVHGGSIAQNTASGNGGGVAVANGNYYMDGGSVDGNRAASGLGGGIYVSAAGSDVTVDVLSGSVSSNTAAVSGGALAVVGKESGTDKITVTIGINENHYDGSGNLKTDLEHGTHGSCTCPVMTGNSSGVSGGAVYVTGNTNTALNIYCLTESGSSAAGENGHSDFMKMEGGKVNITTSEYLDDDNQTSVHGNTKLQNTIYVTGGQMDIWGAMTNPRIEDIITVDVVKEGDYFKDHRPVDSESYYKVLYFENFTDPDTGMTSGQYKEKEVKVTAKETISGSIYSHPGYTIVGWHTAPVITDENADDYAEHEPDNESKTYGWYNVGEDYRLIGDITLYAIWEQNGYTVIYDRNAPEGATYAGEMENQDFTYGVTGKLRKNAYTCLGYDFAGWNTKADGTGTSYADEADVLNLTTVKGEAVTLYAQWAPCNHDASHTYTYSLEDGGATLRRDCSCKAYFETVTLSAQDCVYDKAEHPAAVNYSSTVWKPAVVYSSGSTPVNAGTYTASVSGGGKTASVTYTIEKAEQPAPEKPTFEAVKMSDGSTKLNVYPVADSPLGTAGSSHYDGTYDSVAEYRVVYYDANGNEQTVDWVRDTDPGDSIAASFELPVALTNYYVYARYSEGTNYKNSEATRADSVYFFTGNVELIVECGDGVDYVPVAADGGSVVSGITLELSLEEGYYFPETFDLTIRTENDAGADHANPAVLTKTEKYKTYAIGSIPDNSVIRVTIPGAKKLPTIDAWITEGQVFATVSDTSAIISRDSAFTAYFEVHDFASDVYGTPTLKFSGAIPAGTKLILLDKETNAYYSHVTGGSTSSLSLSSFTRMGGTGGYAAPDGELKLQLVVDYSETASGMTGSDQTVTISLAADTAKEPLAEDVDKSVTATLKNVSGFVLSASGTGLSQSITYNYNASAGTASIWNGRSTALVLTPVLTPVDTLPADAYVEYTVGSYSKAVYKNAAGNYVIPLSSVGDGSLTVRLVSRLFPDASTAYAMTAKWYVSDSKASAAPMNGYLAASGNITFTSGLGADISLKVTTDRRLYNVGDAATATVEWKNIPEACELTLTLTRKGGDGTYASTGWSKDISHNSVTAATVSVPLGGQDAGSYCLELTVVSGLIELAEANYYFIIQNE